jgi:type IV pilus assembly protein PilW
MTRQRGATLIELMIALVLGMLLAVGVFSVMALAEGRRRAVTTVNAINADGEVALNLADKWLRSAGSGLSTASSFAYGCKLTAKKGGTPGTQILPLLAALPAPFAAFTASTPIRMAPVVIWPNKNTPAASGQPSDVLTIMGSGTGGGGMPVAFGLAPDASTLNLKHHTLDFAGSDMVLVAEAQTTGGAPADCAITQVQSTFVGSAATALPLGGDYAGTAVSAFSGDAAALNLGNLPPAGAAAANGPQGAKLQFMLVGVGDNSTLFTYDLLQTNSSTVNGEKAVPVAGGVLEMHALYGIGSNPPTDGKITSWVQATGNYAPANLLNGSAASTDLLRSILAVRVGLILRTPLADRVERPVGTAPNANAVITDTAPTLFADLGASLTVTRTLSAAEKNFRYRTMDITLPLRNAILVVAP